MFLPPRVLTQTDQPFIKRRLLLISAQCFSRRANEKVPLSLIRKKPRAFQLATDEPGTLSPSPKRWLKIRRSHFENKAGRLSKTTFITLRPKKSRKK